MLKQAALFIGLCISGLAFGQKYTISGKVTDGATGEDMIYSTILVKDQQMGTETNDYGFYSLTLDKGEYTLIYDFVGYQTVSKTINLTSDLTINVELQPNSKKLKAAVVDLEKRKRQVENKQISVVNMDIKTIKEIPVIFGEVDVLKTITLMPGIQSAGEGNSGINVRGGSQDQNLLLLDEATVYNASHLLGFFSVFNGDAIKDIQVYKGGIPAQYGGRLASLIDIKMKFNRIWRKSI